MPAAAPWRRTARIAPGMATAALRAPRAEPAGGAAGRTHSPAVLRFGPHLFITGDSNHINEQHQGRLPIPPARQEAWRALLRARAAAARALGADFLFLLAPDKQSVYRHLLPPSYTTRTARFLLQDPAVIDPAPALAALARTTDVYPRTDSHWNQLGALVAALAVQHRRQRNLPDILRHWEEATNPGDLGGKLDPVEASARPLARFHSPALLLHDNMVPNNGRIRIFARPSPPAGEPKAGEPQRLLLFGDSFSYDLAECLKELHDVTVQVHSPAMDHALLAAFRPHLVITELTERFVFRLPEIADGHVLPALWLQKIARREQLPPPRGATPEQAAALPAAARDILDWIERRFDPYRPHLRPDGETPDTAGLAAEIDRLTALPGLAERPRLVRELLQGLAPAAAPPGAPAMPPAAYGGHAVALHAAASRPAEAAAILAALPGLDTLADLAALPPPLRGMALIALRNARRDRQLTACLRAACRRGACRRAGAGAHPPASGEILAFALDTLCRLRPRRHRRMEAALAARLAATPLLGPTEHHGLCRYLLDVGRHSEAATRLRLFIAECESDPRPVVMLARLLWADGDPEAARRELAAAARRLPAQPDLAALRAQLG